VGVPFTHSLSFFKKNLTVQISTAFYFDSNCIQNGTKASKTSSSTSSEEVLITGLQKPPKTFSTKFVDI
jgi:hypothetical protein